MNPLRRQRGVKMPNTTLGIPNYLPEEMMIYVVVGPYCLYLLWSLFFLVILHTIYQNSPFT